MKSFIRKWLAARTQPRTPPKPRLNLESLDRRDLPAGITLSSGFLIMTGSSNVEQASVWMDDGLVHARMSSYPAGGGFGTVYERSYLPGAVDEIVFSGGDANDTFSNTTFFPVSAYGDNGNDVITGGNGADELSGGAGNDIIKGGSGADSIYGGTGNDVLHGNSSADSIYGGDNDDQLYGGTGNDVLSGENGNDRIVSVGGGTDTQTGGSGLDSHWLDTTDVLTDSTFEDLMKRVHRIDQFYRYSSDGGTTSTSVSKELSGQDLADPRQTTADEAEFFNNYKSDFSDNPLFHGAGPNMDDVDQGGVGDCYLLAGLSGLARSDPEFVKQMVVDLGDGTYAVRFYRNGQPEHVRVDGDLWTDPYGNLRYAELGQGDAMWVPIIEKAWAFYRRQTANYESIRGGDDTIDEALLGVNRIVLPKQLVPTDVQVVNWYNAGSPAGTLANQIRGGAEAWLYEVKAQLAEGHTVRVGAVPSISNTTAILIDDPTTEEDEHTYRRGTHVFTADSVLTNSAGDVTGIKLRNPGGSYVTITDMTRIYFCLTAGDAWSA